MLTVPQHHLSQSQQKHNLADIDENMKDLVACALQTSKIPGQLAIKNSGKVRQSTHPNVKRVWPPALWDVSHIEENPKEI